MGFLDHSTNNIIIDAVLTDEGRKILAENSSNFSITQFALADDEVDYTIIQKFGRSVGKEKISKNTPVFEASTVSDYALKFKLKTFTPVFINFLIMFVSSVAVPIVATILVDRGNLDSIIICPLLLIFIH